MMGIALAARGIYRRDVPGREPVFQPAPGVSGYVRAGHGGGARACAPLAGKARRGDAPLCSAATVAALWLLWRTAKAQAGCATTEAIRLGQMNRRLAMGLLGAALLVASANAGWVVRHPINPVTRFVSSVSMQFYIWHQTLAVWLLRARIIPSVSATPITTASCSGRNGIPSCASPPRCCWRRC